MISQLFRSMVTTSELDDPASTTKLLPLLVRPNAAEANGEKRATATARVLDTSMINVVGNDPGIEGSGRLGQALLYISDDTPRKNIWAEDGRQSVLDQDDHVQIHSFTICKWMLGKTRLPAKPINRQHPAMAVEASETNST